MIPDDSANMETPNATTATGSGKTAEQVEFEAGAELKRQGKELPDHASDAAREGYASTVYEGPGYPKPPGTAHADETKSLISHKVAPQAQTDRPEPTTLPGDAEKVNPNDQVSVTIDEAGKRYLIEGKGASVKLDYENDLTPESVIATVIDHLQGGRGDLAAADQFASNAVKKLNEALANLHAGTREKMRRLGVTQGSGNPLA